MVTESAEAVDSYSALKDLSLQIQAEAGASFVVCFWLYLPVSTPLPSTILRQVGSDTTGSVPFLMLDEKKRVMLLPLCFLHKEACNPSNSTPWKILDGSSRTSFPFERWVHIGCQVTSEMLRLHINGKIVGERLLTSSLSSKSDPHCLRQIFLSGNDVTDDGFQGYVHGLEVLDNSSSIRFHFVKDPPLQLSVEGSSAAEIDDDSGLQSTIGGKASSNNKFSLDVILLDAFGEPVKKDLEVVASLVYADSGAPVEKPNDAKAPLLMSYDGIEFSPCDRPIKLIKGRASFKLKISQLPSKCGNGRFRIWFHVPKMRSYPFLEAVSGPFECILCNHHTETSPLMKEKSNSSIHLLSESLPCRLDGGTPGLQCNHEGNPRSSSKWAKLGQDNSFATCKADLIMDRAEEEFTPLDFTANEVDNARGSNLQRLENHEVTDNSPSDSEGIGARIPVSDEILFKYCLGSLNERALLLKEIASTASQKELANLAQLVSLYMACSHHGRQIVIAKELVEVGTKVWDMISQNNNHVLWENVASVIKQHFKTIARCHSRSLTQLDLELLRKIAGCQELVSREHFEKLWCWLYPVAFTVSEDWANSAWNSTSPELIEGFITKEDAEYSLQGAAGLQSPGTFILRFPTSRSWPHPDAGNLVVSYVGKDNKIHHRLLSLDFIFSTGEKGKTPKLLRDVLLAEPELSLLGRIFRRR